MSESRRVRSQKRFVFEILGSLVLAAGIIFPTNAQAAVYDFEGLSLTVLDGQDNWLSQPGEGEVTIVMDDTAVNGTQVAKPVVGVASGSYGFLSRENNAAFGFNPFTGEETLVVLQFDTTGDASTFFALGHDVDGDGLLTTDAREVGLLFGTLRDDVSGDGQFCIAAPDFATFNVAPLAMTGDWYRLQLRANLVAGTGSLYYMNLTQGDTSFQAVTGLQNINLYLSLLNFDAGPQDWDAMWLAMRFDGRDAVPNADNLVPGPNVVVGSDAIDTAGLFDPADSKFYLRNLNEGGAADITYLYGPPNAGWAPITGDWDGDETDTVGLHDPVASKFYLRNVHAGGAADITFLYGPPEAGWIPITGDWDGDGTDTVGLYDPVASQFYLRNEHAGGASDIAFLYGPPNAGWTPITGDWDGDGTDTVGLYDPVASKFYLRNEHAGGAADIAFLYGPPNEGWAPLSGDWD